MKKKKKCSDPACNTLQRSSPGSPPPCANPPWQCIRHICHLIDSASPATIQPAIKGEGKPEQQQKCIAVTQQALSSIPWSQPCMQPHHEGIGTVSFTPTHYCTWLQQPKTYSRVTFPLILLSLAPTCRGCRKCQAFELSSQGGSGCTAAKEVPLVCWQSAEATEGIQGGTRLLPGCVGPQEPLWLPGSRGTMV